jgi:hypothetical protein
MKKILLITFVFLLSIGSWGQIITYEFPSTNLISKKQESGKQQIKTIQHVLLS